MVTTRAKPKIGEITTGEELGYKDSHKWIWLPCEQCGKERWVGIRNGKPRFPLCQDCGTRGHLAELGVATGFGGDKHPVKGSNSHCWKGGIIVREGYVRIMKPEHPRADRQGYVKRARLVLEQKLGRYLWPIAVAHHINGVTDDDRPENLAELFRDEHAQLPKKRVK